MLLYYDDNISSDIAALSLNFQSDIAYTITYAKGVSSYDGKILFLHLIGSDCQKTSYPNDFWREQFYMPLESGLFVLADGKRFSNRADAENYAVGLASQDATKYLSVMLMGAGSNATYVVTYGIGLNRAQSDRLKVMLAKQNIQVEEWHKP